MAKLNVKSKLVGHALVWAAMMIAISLIVQDSEKSGHIMILMLGGWFATQAIVSGGPRAAWQAECQAVKGFMGTSKNKE